MTCNSSTRKSCLIGKPFCKLLSVCMLLVCLTGCAGLHDLKKKYLMVFTYQGEAQSVCLVGDFNQWSPDTHCMKPTQDAWEIVVSLPSGAHHYAFVLNRKQWVADPNAMYVEKDGFGRKNSVIFVE